MRPLINKANAPGRYSLVWTINNQDLTAHMDSSDTEFLYRLQQRFGHRVGKFTRIGSRQSYPLKLLKVPTHIQSRVALIGNAAHTLHPVAGQGYNLGMRDVAFLAETIAAAQRNNQDIGGLQVLEAYVSQRQHDHQSVITLTDGLVRVFTHPLLPVKLVRSTALAILDCVAPLKNSLAKRTMGLAGRIPEMAKGRSL
jgi:2-octaprenyl-6-methoxyphenol hydroxylase